MRVEQTKERITRAALAIFSSKGYKSSTTREIATEAGVNEVTLFRHFGNKENLLVSVIERHSTIPVVIETLDRDLTGDYRKDLITIAEHILDVWEKRKHLIMIMLREAQQHPDEVGILRRAPKETREYLARYFAGLHKGGTIRKLNFSATAEAFVSGLFGHFMTSNMFGASFHPYSRKEYVRNFVDVFAAGTEA